GDNPKGGDSGAPREVRLKGLTLLLGPPRVVAETSAGHCWYPDLLKFSSGGLMLTYSLNADSNVNQHNSQAVLLSSDQGRTFTVASGVRGCTTGGVEPRAPLANGRIGGPSPFLKRGPPGQGRRFAAHYWVFDKDGHRYSVEPWGVTVEGLPRDVEPWS